MHDGNVDHDDLEVLIAQRLRPRTDDDLGPRERSQHAATGDDRTKLAATLLHTETRSFVYGGSETFPDISQGDLSTSLRRGEEDNNKFITNLWLFQAVKELLKSVSIGRSFQQK